MGVGLLNPRSVIALNISFFNENFKKVKTKLDSYARRPIDAKMVEEVFYIQDLLAEVKRNAS